MKARAINGLLWAVALAALAVYTLSQGWDAVEVLSTIFGHTLLCGALWAVIDNHIKEAQQ